MVDQPEQQPVKLPDWMTRWHDMHDKNAAKKTAANENIQEPAVEEVNEASPVETPAPPPSAPDSSALQEKLHDAVLRNNAQDASILITEGAVPAEKTLDYAVNYGRADWASMLINAGAKPTAEMLHTAVTRYGDKPALASVLITGGVVPGQKTLDYAVNYGRPDWASVLIKAGAKPTPEMLHSAVTRYGDKPALVSVLIAGKAVPGQKTLDYTVNYGRADWASILIKAGAKPTSEMLHTAVTRYGDKPALASVLIAGKAVPEEKTLAYAVNYGRADWVSLLINAGAKPTSEMLHTAVTRYSDKPSLTSVLIKGGAVPEQKTLDYASARGQQNLLNLLLMASTRAPRKQAASEVGDKTADGWVYAGLSPDTGKPLFAAPADAGRMDWPSAVKAADDSGARLPSAGELKQLFNNRAKIGGFDQTSPVVSYYWSSTYKEDQLYHDGLYAMAQGFEDGRQQPGDINTNLSVRFVKSAP